MGAAIGDALHAAGHDVIWASEGRSAATHQRARALRNVGTVDALSSTAELIFSICPPHAAADVARAAAGFSGIYVDANAISPARSRAIAALQPRLVDGGIIGPPPRAAGETRLYLSGAGALGVAELFEGSLVDARVVPDASALKMVYAAWSKGTAALLLSLHRVAEHYEVARALEDEWRLSQPQLLGRLASAERSAAAKGWRWVGELEEIADTFGAAGEPEGFHRAAAEVFRT
ncbi:MAG: DUF1932 domain-containing protein [Actinobacteria bacterium]|nr:DUF1932 domain-containing protein [Actinomycetota bacterium]